MPSSAPSSSPVIKTYNTNGCRTDSHKYINHCYYVHPTRVKQTTCKDICASRGDTLPCIESFAENNKLPTFLNDEFWLGYERLNGNWAWPNGCHSSYTNWAAGEPVSSRDCAYSVESNGSLWNASACNVDLAGCMCEDLATPPHSCIRNFMMFLY